MIQRIQTLYLFISAVLTVLLLQLKYAELVLNNQVYTLNVYGISLGDKQITSGLIILILIALIILVQFITIFLYKKRVIQIRFVILAILLFLGLTGIIFYYAYTQLNGSSVALKVPVVLPLIGAVLDYLAIRAIKKDEELVRSLNRIR